MADKKLPDLAAVTTVASGDTLYIMDVSDTTDSSDGTSKKITKANLVTGLAVSDISDITASAAELNIMDGATLDVTELNYVDGVTSAIQTQMDLKSPLASPTFTGTVTIPTPFTIGAISMTSTATELNLLDGITVLSGSNTGDETSATSSAEGIAELAITAEIDTGTDSTRIMPIDQYVASSRNVRYVDWRVLGSSVDQATDTTVSGDFEFPFTGTMTAIGAYVDTAGSTGSATYDVNNGGTTIMSATKITIETGEKSSRDALTQPVLSTTAVTAGDIFTVDIDAVQTTEAKGLIIRFEVRLT